MYLNYDRQGRPGFMPGSGRREIYALIHGVILDMYKKYLSAINNLITTALKINDKDEVRRIALSLILSNMILS